MQTLRDLITNARAVILNETLNTVASGLGSDWRVTETFWENEGGWTLTVRLINDTEMLTIYVYEDGETYASFGDDVGLAVKLDELRTYVDSWRVYMAG